MSRDPRINQPFADGDYSFRLGWQNLVEVQEQTQAGPYVVLQRLLDGSWKMEDISEIVRIGLIGGGTDPGRALTLIKRYVRERPPTENVTLAQAILMAGLMGAPDEPVKPAPEPEQTTETTVPETGDDSQTGENETTEIERN